MRRHLCPAGACAHDIDIGLWRCGSDMTYYNIATRRATSSPNPSLHHVSTVAADNYPPNSEGCRPISS
jgi:hypothetical protein